MGLLQKLKEVWNRMLGNNDKISKITGATQISDERMQTAMALWESIYTGQAPWTYDKSNNRLPQMGLASSICEETARLIMLEFAYVGAGTSPKAQLVDRTMQGVTVKRRLEERVLKGLYQGGFFLRANVDGAGGIDVTYTKQADAYIMDMVDDVPVHVAFPSQLTKGDTVYTRFEIHRLFGDGEYTIDNIVYKSKDRANPLGALVELTDVEEWAKVSPHETLYNMKGPLYGFYRVASANVVDVTSPLGVACFADAVGKIKEADEQWGRLMWEMNATEAAVHMDETLLKSTMGRDGKVENRVPEGKERMFVGFKAQQGLDGSKTFYEPYLPGIRDANQINVLEQILMQIENKTSLPRGTLFNNRSTDQYTNELSLKLARNKTENMVRGNQVALQAALEGLIGAISALCDLYELATGELEEGDHFRWGDSIVIDDASRLESMRLDVDSGLIPQWMYVADKYKLTEEEAKAWVAEASSGAEPIVGLD